MSIIPPARQKGIIKVVLKYIGRSKPITEKQPEPTKFTANKNLQDENERLEEALQDIASHWCPKIYSPTCPEIAEQALKEMQNE